MTYAAKATAIKKKVWKTSDVEGVASRLISLERPAKNSASFNYAGTEVSINPITGNFIQANPLRGKK